jgi:hypothetical protein
MPNDHRCVLKLKPLWNNGSCTYEVTYPKVTSTERNEIDRLADNAGYERSGETWTPPRDAKAMQGFHEQVRAAGYRLEYDDNPDQRPFNLQRLHLEGRTRHRLETLQDFELYHLSGWTPVQAEGNLNGCYWYFRARGSYWRFELGGNENGSRSPRWWYEETWPTHTGFGAGYLTDEEAITCILGAIGKFRYGDNSHFMPDHPNYERTILDGWSLGAISLRTAAIRLGITFDEVVEKAKVYDIELPYTAERELQHLREGKYRLRRLRRRQ